MKEINLAKVAEVLRKCPPKGSVQLRAVNGRDGAAMIVPSFSAAKKEYLCTVVRQGEAWLGECRCTGWGQLKNDPEPVKPCVHVAYRLRELPAFVLLEEVKVVEKTVSPVRPGAVPLAPPVNAENAAGRPFTGPLVAITGPASALPAESPAVEVPADRPEVLAGPTGAGERKVRSIWPSGFAVIEACAAAAWGDADEIVVSETGDAAVVGSCVHEIAKDIVEQGLPDVPPLDAYLVKWDLQDKRDDVFFLSLFVSQAWAGYKGVESLKRFFPSPICEKKLEHTILATDPATGQEIAFRFATKADVLCFSAASPTELPTSAAVVDWKSGDKDKAVNPLAQMWSNAFVVAAQHKTIQTVNSTFVWLRDRTYVTVEFSRDELRERMLEFVRKRAFWDGKSFEKGRQCLYCPRLATCPGRVQLIASIASGLTGGSAPELSLIVDEHGKLRPTDKLARAIEQGRFLQKVLYGFFDELAEQLYATGPLPVLGQDGSWVGVTQKAGKTQIDMKKGWEVLTEVLTEPGLRSLATCSKTALQDAVYAKTEYGKKKEVMESVLARLEQVKAVSHGAASLSAAVLSDPKKAVQKKKEALPCG